MTAAHPGSATPEYPTGKQPRRTGKFAGIALSGTVLVIANLITVFFTVIAWLMMPSGPGDSNHIEGAWFTAFTGTVLAVMTVLLTIIPVAARWLGKKWLIVPVVLFALATVRWMYIDAVYPEAPRHLSGAASGPSSILTTIL